MSKSKGHTPMKVRSHSLRLLAARGVGVLCAVLFLASTHAARADSSEHESPGERAACVSGVPGGGAVDVAVIIEAVNNALNGCSD